MGIPKFIANLKKRNYNGAFINLLPTGISTLSLDFNSIIHDRAQFVYGYGMHPNETKARLALTTNEDLKRTIKLKLFDEIGKYILELVDYVKPRDVLMLAVDGVAPLGKIQQQRERRYKNILKEVDPPFDSTCITPGTQFMIELDYSLQSFIQDNKLRLPKTVVYSGHLVPGEGEHKIFKMMRENMELFNPQLRHVVYGLDADLVVLSLLSGFDIYLIRKDVTDVVDIKALSIGLESEFNLPTAIDDFAFMLSILGNDFLPRVPEFDSIADGLEVFIGYYGRLKKPFIGVDSNGVLRIEYNNFAEFLQMISQDENNLLHEAMMREHQNPSRMFRAATTTESLASGIVKRLNVDLFRQVWYTNEFRPKCDDEYAINLMVKLGLPGNQFEVTPDKVAEMTIAYLTNIEWVFRYYNGQEVNDKLYYPFYHAPLLSDLASVSVLYKGTNEIMRQVVPPLNPLHQLMMVIPRESRGVCPPELQILYGESSPISDQIPEGFPVEKDNTDGEEHFKLIIPKVDWMRIVVAVNDMVKMGKGRLNDFRARENIIIRNEGYQATYHAQNQMLSSLRTLSSERGRGGYAPRGSINYRGRGFGAARGSQSVINWASTLK